MKNATDQWDEVQNSNMLRSIDLANVGLDSPDATPDDFMMMLEALCDVADGNCDVAEFAEKTNLSGQERLN